MIEFYGHQMLNKILKKGDSILELGNQQMNLEKLQGISAKRYYTDLGYKHTSIDLNGNDGALPFDLCEPIELNEQFDVVTDFGTIEHVKDLYPALKNVYYHCKEGGVMYHKNPKIGNFNDNSHEGCHHFTQEFWKEYAKLLGAECKTEEHAIYHNTKDGWEVIATIKKGTGKFMTKDKFKTLLKYVDNK